MNVTLPVFILSKPLNEGAIILTGLGFVKRRSESFFQRHCSFTPITGCPKLRPNFTKRQKSQELKI